MTDPKYRIDELPNAEFYYYPDFLQNHEEIFQWLLQNVQWTQQEGASYGKTYQEPRKKCIFSTNPGRDYNYSTITTTMQPFPDPLEKLRKLLVDQFGVPVNSCIANLYENGSRYIARHRDKETSLVPGMPILSISLGAVRHFDLTCYKPANMPDPPHPTHDKVRLDLASGSLVYMGKDSQVYYEHCVPKQLTIKEPRINLTFRVCKE